jgi:stromal membrane-associated protein
MCIRCSGIHRNLGVHISFVRSVSLDEWKSSHVENMVRWGNRRANAYWEAAVPDDFYIPDENDAVQAMERWIREKYEKGRYKAKSKPKNADMVVDLSAPYADIVRLAAGKSEKKGDKAPAAGGAGAPLAAGGAGASPAAPPAAKAAAKAAPSAPRAAAAADPFDLLGFDAFPSSAPAPAPAPRAAASADDLADAFSNFGVTPGAPAPPAPQTQASKTADIMSLFSAPAAPALQGFGGGGAHFGAPPHGVLAPAAAWGAAPNAAWAGAPQGAPQGAWAGAPQGAWGGAATATAAPAHQSGAMHNPFDSPAQIKQPAPAAAPAAGSVFSPIPDAFASFSSL